MEISCEPILEPQLSYRMRPTDAIVERPACSVVPLSNLFDAWRLSQADPALEGSGHAFRWEMLGRERTVLFMRAKAMERTVALEFCAG